jgi:hypothetical protein
MMLPRTWISFVLLALVPACTLAGEVVIAPVHGERIMIAIDTAKVSIKSGNVSLVGAESGGKRYYHQGTGGEAVAEIKSGDDGFKLRSPAAKLLWKVKISDDKIKIADNEEMQHPWSIKFHSDEHAKVLDAQEKEIGAVKFNAGTGKIKIKDSAEQDQYVVESGKRSVAYGVLLMKDVPEQYRDIIVAELIARGK